MTKPGRAALLGGMGYPLTETAWGMPQLKTRLEGIGVSVLLVNWAERQAVYDWMKNFEGVRIYAGDSLGAGSAAQYPGDVTGEVDFAAGFQPSLYDARAHGGYVEVARNVVRAHCIYDPRWIDTMGLGNAEYRTAFGAKTKLIITQHYGAHPDDWGWSQDLIFNEIKGLLA